MVDGKYNEDLCTVQVDVGILMCEGSALEDIFHLKT